VISLAEETAQQQVQVRDPMRLGIEEIVRDMRIIRARYIMPDTSAYVRYLPHFDPNPEDFTVNVDPNTEQHEQAERTGEFSIRELVTELVYAYIQIHLFPNRVTRNFFIAGFNDSLVQLEFVGGRYDFNRLWINAGTSNLGIPSAIFLGQRPGVNGQPMVSLIDHRESTRGVTRYRAVRGYGDHVGEEFFDVS